MKGNLLMQSVLACVVMQAPVSYAGAFHTIIGPDGRPMVVQPPDQAAKPAAPPAVQNALPAAAQEERLPEPSAHLNPAQAQKIQHALQDLALSSGQQKTQSVMLQPQAALAPSGP